MSKFPTTITTASDARAKLQVMTCAFETISLVAVRGVLCEIVVTDIIANASFTTHVTEKRNNTKYCSFFYRRLNPSYLNSDVKMAFL